MELALFAVNLAIAAILAMDISESIYASQRLADSFGVPLRLVYGASAAAVLLLPCFLMGITMPLVSEVAQRQLRSTTSGFVTTLFILNTLGSVLGGLAAGFVLMPYFGQKTALVVGASCNCAGAAILFVLYLARYSASDWPAVGERLRFRSGRLTREEVLGFWLGFLSLGYEMYLFRVAALAHDQRLRDGWEPAPPVCLTIHNLAFQGNFPAAKFALTNLPPAYFQLGGMEFYGGMNCLKAGISYADVITTVSPRYAREITTEQFGCGLDGALRQRQDALVGILNGVDYEEWTTVGNPYLSHSYTADDFRGKAANKAEMQEELALPVRAEVPLFGTVSRLADQKGVDIQLGALEEMLSADMQFILLGSGWREFERGYRKLALRHPGKCAVKFGFDTTLSHRIESACDFFLMPSRFEPCGLNQLYSLRYGTVPIVRVTGGLDDSVTDATEDPDNADGIKFREYSVRALAKAIRKALVLYGEKDLLDHYRRNGMAKDFSWERTALAYEEVYRQALRARQTAKPVLEKSVVNPPV